MSKEDMFILTIPRNRPFVEEYLDKIIKNNEIVVKDHKLSQKFGMHIIPLRRHRLMGKYYDRDLHETIFRLKIPNIGDIVKKNGRGRVIEYKFPIPLKKRIL